jgi:hypothetical protein
MDMRSVSSRHKKALLCASLLAASLGTVSLVAGLHRMPLSTTCACAGLACYIAADLWPRKWLRAASLSFYAGAIVAFFTGIR